MLRFGKLLIRKVARKRGVLTRDRLHGRARKFKGIKADGVFGRDNRKQSYAKPD